MASSRITGTNENISTYGTLGAGRDYDVLADWEAFTDVDLVTATTSEVLECYEDSASYADSVTIAAATTNATYFRIIRAVTAARHNGLPGTGILFNPTTTAILISAENYAAIIDIEANVAGNTASNIFAFQANSSGNNNKFLNCIGKCTNAGAGTGTAFDIQGTSVVANCLGYESKTFGFSDTGNLSPVVSNCTAIGNTSRGYSFTGGAGTIVVKNCLSSGNGTGFNVSKTSTGSTTNASSDTTAIGTVSYQSQTFTFVNAASDNYHLHRNDLGAAFRGTNLSADTFPFDDDIDGNTIVYWNIGIDSSSTIQSSRRTGDNENISTFGTLGAGRDYDVFGDWEAFTDNDLVTAATTEVLECYDDAASFNISAAIAGATTDRRYFRIVRAAVAGRWDGTPLSGFVISGTATNQFDIAENNFVLQDITVVTAGNSAGTVAAARVNGAINGVIITGVRAKATNAGAGVAASFNMNPGASTFTRLVNCMAWESDDYGFFLDGAGTKYAFNCTAVNNGVYGFRRNNGTAVVSNCLADGNLTADFNGTMTQSYNAATDTSADGTGSRDSQTFTYVNDAGSDYHLTYLDAGALGYGTSMDTNVFYNYNDDIDFVDITTWSIGFDSDAAAPASGGGSFWLKRRRRC